MATGQGLDTDLPCAKCGYNLRGFRARERCPECGWLVADTLNKEIPVHKTRAFDLKVGSVLLLSLPVLFLVGFGVAWLLDPTPLGAFLLVCILLLVLIPAYFLLKLPRTRVVSRRARCQACRYDLRGITSNRCPNCGSWLTPPNEKGPPPRHGAV